MILPSRPRRRDAARLLSLTFLVSLCAVSGASAQNCASCTEFFLCRGSSNGGYFCHFQEGPCREAGQCGVGLVHKKPDSWFGAQSFSLEGHHVDLAVGGDMLWPVDCTLAATIGAVEQVGNGQYVRHVRRPSAASDAELPQAAGITQVFRGRPLQLARTED